MIIKKRIYYDCCKLIKCTVTLGFWCRVGFTSVVLLGENHLNRSFSARASSIKWRYNSPSVEHILYHLVKWVHPILSESLFSSLNFSYIFPSYTTTMIGKHGAILYLVPYMNDGLFTLAYLVYYHTHLLTLWRWNIGLGFKVGVTFGHIRLVNHNSPTFFFSFLSKIFKKAILATIIWGGLKPHVNINTKFPFIQIHSILDDFMHFLCILEVFDDFIYENMGGGGNHTN
jgi:hypothetical protein